MGMESRGKKSGWVLAVLLLLGASGPVAAGNVLFVANGSAASSDSMPSAVPALQAAGHTVTAVYDDFSGGVNTTLQGSLTAYDAVVWAASDDNKSTGTTTSAATISSLESYVSAGGFLFITGYDSIASPIDQLLADFIAGASGVGISDTDGLGPIALSNVLTQGAFNLVGVTPASLDDQDYIDVADLGPSAQGVSCDSSGCSWVLRTLGSGFIAYVSTDGESDGDFTDSDPSDAYFAYHAALINFVGNAASVVPVPVLPFSVLAALGVLIGLLGMRKLKRA